MPTSDLSIAFRGLVADGLGVALWQADGTGPEPAATGHTFVTPIETITAHYYIASRDYIDPSSRGCAVATALGPAWRNLRASLQQAQCAPQQLVIRLPLTTAGADREGEDWFYADGVETRCLRPQAPLSLSLDAETMLEFAPARLILTEDYRGARHFGEVAIGLRSDPTPARIAPERSFDRRARALIDAFLADLGGRPVRFAVDKIELTAETFDGQGRRNGRYAEIPAARLEVV